MEMKKTGCEKSKYWLAMKLQNIYVDYGFDLIESHNVFKLSWLRRVWVGFFKDLANS